MGEASTDKRSSDTLAMLDYGFNMYSIEKMVGKNKSLGTVDVNMGKKEKVDIQIVNDVTVLNNNQKGKRNIIKIILKGKEYDSRQNEKKSTNC